MIRSFKCKETDGIWQGRVSRALPREIQDRAFRKLRQLDAPWTIADLCNPPSNWLEILNGDRVGQKSIRINEQWGLCSRWNDNDVMEVEIVDYH